MLGNGPTDLLSLVAPFVLIGARLSDNDKTKQDKVGIVLQEGVPVIGGVGAYLFGIAKQLTGPTALLTSFGFGVALNTIGSLLFKAYKDAQNINLSLPQFTTTTEKRNRF
jgi:hypothetical protein